MADCIFCKIANREMPAEVVYADEDFLAFLDINPLSPGHLLVIPARHHRWVWEVKEIGRYFEVVRRLALALQNAFKQEAIWSKVVGEDVPHAHVWLFPDPRPGKTAGRKDDFKGNAEKIRRALALK